MERVSIKNGVLSESGVVTDTDVLIESEASAAESVSAAFVIGLIKSSASIGLILDDSLTELGFGEPSLADPLGRISYSQLLALLDHMAQLTPYPRELGIEIGQRLMPGSFSALGYAAASGKTLGEAIETISSYEKVALTAGKTELVIADGWAQLYWSTSYLSNLLHSSPSLHSTHSYLLEEIILSAWVKLASSITELQVLPIKVMFSGSEPENSEPFTEFFGSDISFCQPKACVLFPKSLLKTPIIHSDPYINNLMRKQATHIHQALNTAALLSSRVGELIRERLADGDFGQESVASELCLSIRTLRRRLKAEGTSYQSLLDSARRDLARDYLADTTLSVYEVAMQLGYAEHSAFSAAFKRWFGIAPQAFRAKAGI